MSQTLLTALLYLLPLMLALVLYARRHQKKETRYRARLAETVKSGIAEPLTLHPVIDTNKCIGSGACVKACPEHSLGIVRGKAVLVAPDHCIGHGACESACPVEAITLVFGTEKRGIDIPQVKPTFETNVPGIYIAGELGGMGLIRKGVDQGQRAIESIRTKKSKGSELDVVIVGAGPAGISASLAAKEAGLRFVTVEQEDSLGGSIYHYPRRKVAMTAPMTLPMVGKFNKYEISKEELLTFWTRITRDYGIKINFSERMEAITKTGSGFLVKTSKDGYKTKNVLLAIGRRGTPRKLGVPGEEQPKVVYRLIDAEQYRGQHVLVVGGGDSAAEAALAIAAERGTTVTISCRSDEIFTRPKEKNRQQLKQYVEQKKLTVYLQANVKEIGAGSVTLLHEGKGIELKNDAVIVCAGGTLPTPMLKEIGVMVDTYYGQAARR
ncbi:MAG TPA: NAD(P)-binding domain-containing protein [Nitrospiraceae bacterium]|nr:NAD(P)-binding domain-containing protein [Nitrospiraceae bacterium]